MLFYNSVDENFWFCKWDSTILTRIKNRQTCKSTQSEDIVISQIVKQYIDKS